MPSISCRHVYALWKMPAQILHSTVNYSIRLWPICRPNTPARSCSCTGVPFLTFPDRSTGLQMANRMFLLHRTTRPPTHSVQRRPHHAPTEHGPHAHQSPPAGPRARARHTYAPATPCLSGVSTFPLTNNSRSRAWHTGSRRSSEWAPPCAPGAPPPASAGGAALQPRGRSPPRATEQ